PFERRRCSNETAVDATHQRVRTQTVRAVNGIIAFTRGQQSGNVRVLIEVYPQTTHRIMHAGKDAHGHVPRIVADKHLVYFQDSAQLLVERLSRDMSEIEIDLVIAAYAKAVETHLKDFPRRDVARHKVSVCGILLV